MMHCYFIPDLHVERWGARACVLPGVGCTTLALITNAVVTRLVRADAPQGLT
jgi:hypothetical protein